MTGVARAPGELRIEHEGSLMALGRGDQADSGSADADGTAPGDRVPLPSPDGPARRREHRIDPETSTALLRRCTALATRARADLLTPGRHDAADELAALLAVMETWTPEALADPDPTMTVLAAAALQDLAARLPEPAAARLGDPVDAVIALLREVMVGGRVDVPA